MPTRLECECRRMESDDIPEWVKWSTKLGKTTREMEQFLAVREHWMFFDGIGRIMSAHVERDGSTGLVDVVFNPAASRRRVMSALAASLDLARREQIKTISFDSTAHRLINFLSRLAPSQVNGTVVSLEVA